mgnify:CR=1 FL=1
MNLGQLLTAYNIKQMAEGYHYVYKTSLILICEFLLIF